MSAWGEGPSRSQSLLAEGGAEALLGVGLGHSWHQAGPGVSVPRLRESLSWSSPLVDGINGPSRREGAGLRRDRGPQEQGRPRGQWQLWTGKGLASCTAPWGRAGPAGVWAWCGQLPALHAVGSHHPLEVRLLSCGRREGSAECPGGAPELRSLGIRGLLVVTRGQQHADAQGGPALGQAGSQQARVTHPATQAGRLGRRESYPKPYFH